MPIMMNSKSTVNKIILVVSALAAISFTTTTAIPATAVCLYQRDFDEGTVIIDEPGQYKLCENIVFSPNEPTPGTIPPDDAFDPIFPSEKYNENKFNLGFFAAIVITASNVDLFLNSFTIEQSVAHALFQRFFAVIELADAPFIQGAGPAQFINENNESPLQAASNVRILGPGTIGRSSHHGIHGNENSRIQISFVEFRDFEVAAVSLNNVDGLIIGGCNIPNNRHDVPVLGLFSAARFIRPYGKKLADMNYEMNLRGELHTAATVYSNLMNAINNVYMDVMEFGYINKDLHPMEHHLFDNPFRTIDGPCYVFAVHGKGPAVGGFGEHINETDTSTTSSDVLIMNNNLTNIKCWTKEIPAVVDNDTVMNDARGAVLQFVDTVDNSGIAMNTDGTYKGNVVADMQIMTANAILEGVLEDTPSLQTGPNTINKNIVNWAMSNDEIYVPHFRCNGDSMHHVSKGMIAMRIENTIGFKITDNIIANITNLSPSEFYNCYDYHAGASMENYGEHQGTNVRAMSIAASCGYQCKFSLIGSNKITNLYSNNARIIIGMDFQGDSREIGVEKNIVFLDNLIDGYNADDTPDIFSIRLREYTRLMYNTGDLLSLDNELYPMYKIEGHRKLRRKNQIPFTHPNLDGGDIEWKNGGCPFAHAKGQARK